MASFLLMLASMLSAKAIVLPGRFDYEHPRGRMVPRSSCYIFVWNHLLQAKHNCQRHGAHLVSIETKEENNYLVGIIQRHNNFGFWTGGNDISTEGKWQWVADHSKICFTDWKVNNPDNWQGNEHCLHLMKYEEYGVKWNDDACGTTYAPICEKPC